MASKKKSGIKGAAVKTSKAEAAAKRKALNAKAKAAKATGNTALERANAVAKKGAAKGLGAAAADFIAKNTKAKKGSKKGPKELTNLLRIDIDAAADKAVQGADLPPVTTNAKKAPQFFGRKKVAKEVDPVKVREQRNATHAQMMQLDWYADYRKDSIELWVERRKAEAAGDTAAIDKINKKLDSIARKRDKAKAEWKAAGAKLPALPKTEKPEPVKKAAKKGKKAAAAAAEEAPAVEGSQTVPDTVAAPEPGDVRVTD